MDRREFTKLSAFALAGSLVPSSAQNAAPAKPVGYAAIGLGRICDIFMRACGLTQSSKITALVTGHPVSKGVKYSDMYGIPQSSIYTYDTFDEIVNNKDVDAVYIGLPNSMHCEYTLRAAAAGKHVLCEKPMAISSTECRQMIDGCRKANRKLMIAYRVQYEPTWNHAIDLISSGALGQMQAFQGGFYGQMAAGDWRFNRKLAGGGSLLDLGIYPLNAIRHVTGEEPTEFTAVVATRDHGGRFVEVEQSLEWTMKFPSGIIASCGCSYGQVGPNYLMMNGEKGTLEMNPGFTYDGPHLQGIVNGQRIDQQSTGKHPYVFALEANHFSDCVRNDKEPKSPGEDGLKDLIAIEAIYKAAGTPMG